MTKLLNNFLLGADPEATFFDSKKGTVNAYLAGLRANTYFGFDHGGLIVEPHPLPSRSARIVCRNITDCLKSLAMLASSIPPLEKCALRSNPCISVSSPHRWLGLGGHVHLDVPNLMASQIDAMDAFTKTLEDLELLPSKACAARREFTGYGLPGAVRFERGRVEYRSLASWLFDRRIAMLSITGIKLCQVAPTTMPVKGFDSRDALKSWIELFAEKDDDARWILDRDYFTKIRHISIEKDLFSVWKVESSKYTLNSFRIDSPILQGQQLNAATIGDVIR